ncbi:5-hydroxyisourate hydrolase [Haloechinothrix alba]|uniref:5-hydroxyisourate hydrolase n=1 Tax=Haloechinothrix alba TaxID=664784 RepID=A0A238YS16_9PSEU|nr:hydroxyisourate hydrolase [Haloechinothrix alba]SNR73219.1 5-hydroxyisourate hydrolase [Haloechinothrix alba]
MTTISTHVLDAARGLPAAGVPVRLESREADGERLLGSDATDSDGRIGSFDGAAGTGTYRLVFDTGTYFADAGRPCFFPEVVVTFTVTGANAHFHVPILLSPYSYTTYRGS